MAKTLEEPEFEILRRYKEFEVRKYVSTIQARVTSDNPRNDAPSIAFRRIANYIFGNNERAESIAMTAPVHTWTSEGSSIMAFTLPSEHEFDDLPVPNDGGIDLLQVEGEVVAVLGFSGFSGQRKTLKLQSKLRSLVEKENLTPLAEAKLAVYDHPGTLPFIRRNEIHLPIEWTT